MSKRIKFLHHLAVLLAVTVLCAGCNIFGFASDVELSPVEKAEEAIREHDYVKAKAALSDVIYPDPDDPKILIIKTNDSMELYTYAKAALLESGITLLEIMDLAQNDEESGLGANNPILSIIDNKFSEDPSEVNAWYQQNRYIQQVLQLIADGETYGIFETDDIALDLAISSLMSCMLGIRDTNQDGFIDDKDFNLAFLLTQHGDIDAFALEGLYDAFKDDPQEINDLIEFIGTSAENSAKGISLLVGEEQAEFVEDIQSNIEDTKQFLDYYKYDDGVDNDGDGRIDEELFNGIDDDFDGLVDEDTGPLL